MPRSFKIYDFESLVGHSTEVVLEFLDLVEEFVLLSVPEIGSLVISELQESFTSRSRCVLATTC